MKRLKKISLIALGLASVATMTACSNSSIANTLNAMPETKEESYPEVNYDEDYTNSSASLSSVILNTTNVKTTYYLGDELNLENLVVTARYITVINGKRVSSDVVVTDYSIDTSEVKMYEAGTYPITVQYRSGTILKEKSFNVTVKNNEYEGLTNIKYYSGIDMKWTTAMKSDSDFITSSNQDNMLFIYVNTEEGKTEAIKKKITTGSFDVTAYLTMVDPNGNASTTAYPGWAKHATLDVSSLDVSKPGTYMAKVSIQLPESIAGTDIAIVATGFVMITVVDVVTEISYAGYYENGVLKTGQKDFEASLDQFDYSDMAFNVTYYSGVKTLRYGDNKDLFQISSTNSYTLGAHSLTATFTEADLKGNFPQTPFSINVVTSGHTYTTMGSEDNEFINVVSYDESTDKYSDVTLDTEKAITEDGSVVANNVTGHAGAATYEGISFTRRIKLTKNTGYITLTTKGAAKIKYYVAYSATAGTNAIVVDGDGNSLFSKTFDAGTGTSGISSTFTVEVKTAGSYKLYTTNGTLYLYGMVVEE